MESKKIILCADDFGQTAENSQGIAQLLAQQRISATSCMTNCYQFVRQAPLLQRFLGKADIGLHFNLTHDDSLVTGEKFSGLPMLLLKSYSYLLSRNMLEKELMAQITAFEKALGQLPDYIDGHQHIHQFPMIRDVLVNVYLRCYPKKDAYVRVLNFTPTNSKERILHFLGANALQKLLDQQDIPHNSSFAGIYNLSGMENYRQLFQRFLARSENNGIIMCHAGLASKDRSDPIIAARTNEYRYFLSEDFIRDCAEANAVIAPLRF